VSGIPFAPWWKGSGYETGYAGKWHLPYDVKKPETHGFLHTGNIKNNGRRSYQASAMFPVSGVSDDKWRQYAWAYYRMIEKTDAGIGSILDVLRESGLDRNTIVVLLSDHGDCQGAHHWNQKTVFFEEASKVPFIISHKAIKPGKSDYLVQTGIDLLPTLCDLAGISPGTSTQGTSLKELLLTGKPAIERDYIVVSDRLIQGDTIDGYKPGPNGRMLRTQRFKYWILDEGTNRETLYDLENDPGEMKNLANDPGFRTYLEECRKKYAEWALEYKDQFSGGEKAD
jgi:arylsulfatase A-like enzyme